MILGPCQLLLQSRREVGKVSPVEPALKVLLPRTLRLLIQRLALLDLVLLSHALALRRVLRNLEGEGRGDVGGVGCSPVNALDGLELRGEKVVQLGD